MSESRAEAEKLPFFAGEVQLANWNESAAGGCKVVLYLSDAADLDKFRHMTTREGKRPGQRMYAVFVQLNEQEEAVPPPDPRGPMCMEAIGFCNNGEFMTWITRGTDFAPTSAGAKLALQRRLGINSRKDLDANPEKREAFKRLVQEYYRRPIENRIM